MTPESGAPSKSSVELSVVVPAFNEEQGVTTFLELLFGALRSCCASFEVWMIDDGSRDGTWARLTAERARYPELRALRFTRNFGKEGAILAGLRRATGRAVVVMDADGQHPPALLPLMLEPWRSGRAHIVAAQKAARASDGIVARANARFFNGIMRTLTGLDLTAASDYRLLDRRVVDTLLAFPEKVRFFRGMTAWTGFFVEYVRFDVAPRLAGESHWSVAQLARYAVTAISAYSAKPLAMILRLGFLGMAGSILLLLQALYSWSAGIAVSGWTSLTVVVLFFGSANLLALGVVGIYLAQLFDEIKARPEYLVGDELR